MKRLFWVMLISFSLFSAGHAQQDYKEFMKERKEMAKFTRDELNAKASKDARKEAKKLKKEGWTVAPGGLPLEKQLDRVYMMQSDMDYTTGFPKFIRGNATAVGQNYEAAKLQAMSLAKLDLAGNISTEVAGLIDNRLSNKETTPGEATSTVESVMAAKNLIAQEIGRTIVALEIYRELKTNNKEVRVMIFYNAEMAKEAAKKGIREDLEKKSDKLAEQLDTILGF